MKNKTLICLVVFAFGLFLQGCGPETQILGMVWEDQAGKPVPGAAVMAMIWLEDANKALKKPVFDGKTREAVMELDMIARGQPSAYARGFTDDNGNFKLDKFHFSAETKKKAGQLKNPVVARITLMAFARGYLKTAATSFPVTTDDRAAPALLYIGKPKDWHDLYGQNTADTLTEKYMLNAYSVDYGATKAEKKWMLDYAQANLWKAYTESNIKGSEHDESLCGHDFSDVIISSAGMQRNPSHERCARILWQMGEIRAIEDNWMAYSYNVKTWPETIKDLTKEALAALPAEYTEPKEYEPVILTGIDEANHNENAEDTKKTVYQNGLNSSAVERQTLAEAQSLYNKGNKAGAYRAIGQAIYHSMFSAVTDKDARLRIGEESGKLKAGFALNLGNANKTFGEIENSLATAGLTASAQALVAGIGQSLSGFHLLMNRPQAAQLPGGDDGNHKDKPKIEADKSTEIVNTGNVPIEEYISKVIIEGKWGKGPGEFGYDGFYPEDLSPKNASFTPGDFIYPQSIAIDSKSNIYILDTANNRIQKFNEAGKYQSEFKVDSWSGYELRKDGQDGYIYSTRGINLIIDGKDNLYYYLKRVKDGKETGEVWEFKNDKLIRKWKVSDVPGRISCYEGSVWITQYPHEFVNTDIGEDFNVFEGKKYQRKKINADRKQNETKNIRIFKNNKELSLLKLDSNEKRAIKPLMGEEFSSTGVVRNSKIFISSRRGSDKIMNEYDFSGKLLRRILIKTRPQNGIRDLEDNVYQIKSVDIGIAVTKHYKQALR